MIPENRGFPDNVPQAIWRFDKTRSSLLPSDRPLGESFWAESRHLAELLLAQSTQVQYSG